MNRNPLFALFFSDQNKDLQKSFKRKLKTRDCQIMTIYTKGELTEILLQAPEQFKPDIILLDEKLMDKTHLLIEAAAINKMDILPVIIPKKQSSDEIEISQSLDQIFALREQGKNDIFWLGNKTPRAEIPIPAVPFTA